MNEARKTNALLRQHEALKLHVQSLSLREIAERMNVSHVSVKNYLDRALAQLISEQSATLDAYRAVQLMQLDELQYALRPKAIDEGDVSAIAETRKLMERRAKLLGLDAPTRVQAEVSWQDELKGLGVNPSEVLGALAHTLTQKLDTTDDTP
jgi:predicted DNA-binding protein YlxM (UPF0122 family)